MELPLQNAISLAIIGCVSAGKSTLVNAILVNKMSSTKIKRTTMLPQVYIESNKKDELTKEKIQEIQEMNDRENRRILDGDVELTDANCVNIYHEIPKCYDLMKLPRNISLNINDIPGLNDSTTEKIYYNYIDKSYLTFDIIFIVVDINEAFNTSGSIQILKCMVENAQRYPEKRMKICIIANKCDELQPNSKGELEFVDEEYLEMYEQIEKETDKYLGPVDNIEYKVLKVSAEDSFIYRMYKKNPKVDLDPKLVNKFGLNEFGKRAWTSMTDDKKRGKIRDFFQNEDIEQSLKLTGFNDLKNYMNHTIDFQLQYDIMLNNIKLEIQNIPEYTSCYEDKITTRYNRTVDLYKDLMSIYSKKNIKLDTEGVVKYIQDSFLTNINQIDLSGILKEPALYNSTKKVIKANIDKLSDRFDIQPLEVQYKKIEEEQNKIVLGELDNIMTNIQNYSPNNSLIQHDDILRGMLNKLSILQDNHYPELDNIINKCNDTFICMFCGVRDTEVKDPFILYFDTIQDKFNYSIEACFKYIQRILMKRMELGNIVKGLFDYTLNQLDFSVYNEEFREYLIDLKIAIPYCSETSMSQYIFNPWDGLNKTKKQNVMSLFTYMLSLYELVYGVVSMTQPEEKKIPTSYDLPDESHLRQR
jgi:small GTP-binding protein